MQGLIVIEQIGIRQENGLYCLNDLHRAAGGEKRHQPSDWLRNQQAQELIAELEKTGNPVIQGSQSLNPTSQICGVKQNQQVIQVINGGDFRGTYVCRELVYAYAMWISPRFHLAVIRAFDALQAAPKPALPDFTNPAVAARAWAEQYELNQQQAARLEVAEPKAAALDLIAVADGNQTVTNAAKILKIAPRKLFGWLSEKRWIYKRCGKGAWIGYQDKVQSGYVTHGEHRYTRSNGEQELTVQLYLTPKGIAKIAAVLAKEGVAA